MLRVGGRVGDRGPPPGRGELEACMTCQSEISNRWGPGRTGWGPAGRCGLEQWREGKATQLGRDAAVADAQRHS